MHTIDQRILIPSSRDFVWEYVSEITNNPQWQTGCQDVRFLTQSQTGPGIRWRYRVGNRRDFVIEVTAWYEGAGYEYTIVDGATYKENLGRIRLQEIAEGTIVQWTFSYEPKGLLGNMRNSLTTRRSIEQAIIESLWTLWRIITDKQRQNGEQNFTAKSLMRDAPDVEERSKYRPRHGLSSYTNTLSIEEPPIAEGDTRPRPPEIVSSTINDEPDFLSSVDSPFAPPRPTETPSQPVEPEPTSLEPQQPSIVDTSPVSPTEQEDSPEPVATDQPTPPPPVEERPQQYGPAPIPEPRDEPHARDLSDEDTSNISVFELFGLPKPSETQEIEAVTLPEEAKPAPPMPVTPAPTLPSAEGRTGWRLRYRGVLVKLRRPQ